MRALDLKLFRDLRRLWAQALAIALVIAGGVATLVLAVGSYRSLDETRNAYYERYRFADVFAAGADARRRRLVDQIAEIPGVAAVDARIAKLALLDIPNFREPATGQFISLPDIGEPTLNQLYMRVGPHAGARSGRRGRGQRELRQGARLCTGLALLGDPERPQARARDRRDRAVARVHLHGRARRHHAGRPPLRHRLDVGKGARRRLRSRRRVLFGQSQAAARCVGARGDHSALDALLDRYGGQAAYGRKDQTSHAWLDHELDMLNNMSRTLPPIFLLVAAFLVNLTLSRLVALEREQIGLLKALGYRQRRDRCALHQVRHRSSPSSASPSAAPPARGSANTSRSCSAISSASRSWSSAKSPDLYVMAAALSLAAAIVGAVRALRDVVSLPPAVAMQPPAPPRFRRVLPAAFSHRQIRLAADRDDAAQYRAPSDPGGLHGARHGAGDGDTRSSRCSLSDTMEQLIDVTYFLADRQDATVSFVEKRPQEVVMQVARLPGRACGRALSRSSGPHPKRQCRAPHHDQRPAARCRSQPDHRCRPAPGRACRKAGLAISQHAGADPRRAASAISSKSICSKGQRRTVIPAGRPRWSRTISASGA